MHIRPRGLSPTRRTKYTGLLGEGAVYQTIPEYPEVCWTELIVNAVAHRDYSIKGTDIQIKMYDDHFDVESPGLLPGIVRVNNIREFHFSRNPKIVEWLTENHHLNPLRIGQSKNLRMSSGGRGIFLQFAAVLASIICGTTWFRNDL